MPLPKNIYSGQKFYNPNDHNAPTIKICGFTDGYYMLRHRGQPPYISTVGDFRRNFAGYQVLHNIKNY